MAEQQTRWLQEPVGAILWRCKSSYPHNLKLQKQFMQLKFYKSCIAYVHVLTRAFGCNIIKLVKTTRPDFEQSEHGGFLILRYGK